MAQVTLRRCTLYDEEHVNRTVRLVVADLGGIEAFVKHGQKVLLKPNLLMGAEPGKVITTHPSIVKAVGLLVQEAGGKVMIADSPGAGAPYTEASLRKAYRLSGFDVVAEELGAELCLGTESAEVSFPEGKIMKRFTLIKPVLDADVIISLPKLKTHLLTGMTAAVKNNFGTIPGFEKATFHSRMPDRHDFGEMLVDLERAVRPDLSILDAVIGMEGDGPHNGHPRTFGAIMASPDPHALDLAAARLMGFEPLKIPTISAAHRRGLLPQHMEQHVIGDGTTGLMVHDLEMPATFIKERESRAVRAVMSLTKPYALRPVVEQDKCTGCGACARSCPHQCIHVHNGKARISHKECIRCYCCHEMCPSDAIRLKRSVAGKAMKRVMR
jgi:uncharacterized protein (DUF362 family)/NAD-dependent dihydropyrimidine dehydrogenase PreA subunit